MQCTIFTIINCVDLISGNIIIRLTNTYNHPEAKNKINGTLFIGLHGILLVITTFVLINKDMFEA